METVMPIEEVDTVVVGAGQAGLAMSEHLSAAGIAHVVLERHRIAERWRTARWDSLVANGPAWHDRFPGMEFPGHRDSFPSKEVVADYFVSYAESNAFRPANIQASLVRVSAPILPRAILSVTISTSRL